MTVAQGYGLAARIDKPAGFAVAYLDPVDLAGVLRTSELFRDFEPDETARLGALTSRRHLRRGEDAFRAGDRADQLFVVGAGRVAVSRPTPTARSAPGSRERIVAVLEAGAVFGELGLFDGQVHAARARALEAVEVLAVPYAPVRDILVRRPALLWPVVGLLTQRLRAAEVQLAEARLLDVPARTAKQLLDLAGDRDEFALPITQEELAGMVGASRERVNKALAQFARLGWLQVHERRYRILRRDDLGRRAR